VYDTIVSADISGMVEYWSPREPYELPKGNGLWEYKSQTDLFDFKKVRRASSSCAGQRSQLPPSRSRCRRL
jgi:peptidylprolyl isomerase domain and WD repeat-containing protein 1